MAESTKVHTHEETKVQRAHDHKHGHGHGHHHHGASGNIGLAFFLNFSFSIIELVGGTMIGSLAIVADAVHDFGDSVSLALAWILERYANRRRDRRFNFGYRRFSLLSALVSGVVIAGGSAIIIREAIHRFDQPNPPASVPMMALAVIGLAVNGFAALRLSRGETQNEKILTWHLMEDVMGWAVVLLCAIAIYFTGVTWLDPLLAIGLACFVSFNVLRHLKDTVYLFLQGRPDNFDEALFISEAMAVEGVEHIDHLAVWSLDGETSILSARLHLHSVRDPNQIEHVKQQVRDAALRQKAQATLETCMAKDVPHPADGEDDDDHHHHDGHRCEDH